MIIDPPVTEKIRVKHSPLTAEDVQQALVYGQVVSAGWDDDEKHGLRLASRSGPNLRRSRVRCLPHAGERGRSRRRDVHSENRYPETADLAPGKSELSGGIISVVKDVGRDMDDNYEPTWDEAVAALASAEPVEVVRSPRRIIVVYRYADGVFTATSPDVKGFRASGGSLDEARLHAKQDLADFLDPAVKVVEIYSRPERETAACGHSWFRSESSAALVVLSTEGTASTYMSPARASVRRVPA